MPSKMLNTDIASVRQAPVVVHEGEHEVVALVGVGALQIGPELGHVRGRSHERRDRLDVRSQLGVPDVLGEPLMMVVFAVAGFRGDRIELSNLVQHTRSNPGVNEVIVVLGDLVRPLGCVVARAIL